MNELIVPLSCCCLASGHSIYKLTQSGIGSMQLDMNRYTFADLVYSACMVVALPPKLVRAVVARDCDLMVYNWTC